MTDFTVTVHASVSFDPTYRTSFLALVEERFEEALAVLKSEYKISSVEASSGHRSDDNYVW
jgi:hypothetical protein